MSQLGFESAQIVWHKALRSAAFQHHYDMYEMSIQTSAFVTVRGVSMHSGKDGKLSDRI